MTNEERKEKLAEIFGQQAEYFEDWFGPDDFDERDSEVAKKIGKPLSEIKFGDVLDYINKERPELAKEFRWCIMVAKDEQKHGRVWTEDNPLKTLISRKDVSIIEEFKNVSTPQDQISMLMSVMRTNRLRSDINGRLG